MVTLPEQIREALLVRWREPRRRYHGETHLRDGLNALRRLGGGEVEQIAFWFRETAHGLKVLYRTGLLVEFAVFDRGEFAG